MSAAAVIAALNAMRQAQRVVKLLEGQAKAKKDNNAKT